MPGWEVICWALVIAAPFVAVPAALAIDARVLSAPAEAWVGFAYVSTVSMFLGFFAWYRGLALGGIATVGQVQLVQPFLTIFASAWLLGERIDVATYVAAALVIVSIAVGRRALQRSGLRRARPGWLYFAPRRSRMSRIAIAKEHQLSHKKAKEAAEKVAVDLKRRFELDYRWKGDAIEFERPGLEGTLRVGKDDVRLDCELGFMLSLLKPSIEGAVHREFDKYFGKAKGKTA